MTDTIAQEATGVQTLPESWEGAAYSELGEWSGGGTPSKSNPSYWEDGEVPWFSPKDMHGLELQDSQDHITEGALQDSAAKLIRAGSLLFVVRSGILRRTLPVALSTIDGAVNQDIKALTPSKSLSTKYLLYATLAQKEEIRHRCKKAGTTVESIQVAALQKYRLPIAPLNEQRRIVEKIEELFTKLDAGVRSLEQARAQLKSYRRSVLKAAVEGELSREWREAHKDELEPASELLERILQERREKFAGKKYKEPTSPDTTELPEIPNGWEWISLAQATKRITDGTHQSPQFTNAGVPFIFVQHIVNGQISFEKTKFISEDTYEALNSRCPVEVGDILYSAVGSYGIAVPVDTTRRFSFQRHIAHVKPLDSVNVKYLVMCLNSPGCRSQAHRAARGVAQKTVALGELSKFYIPLPPAEEQRFIVDELERRLSVVDKLEATIEENLKQANALRQSILKRAFSGELVPQDSDDEPASVLLKRIREERQAKKQRPNRGRRGRTDPAERVHAEQGGLF